MPILKPVLETLYEENEDNEEENEDNEEESSNK
jgi:hypothetical protein